MSILIKNVRVMQTEAPFDVKENMDVFVDDGIIKMVGANLAPNADKVIDGRGKTLIPGNVCSHHHYYSGLSRGMLISAGPQTDFIQVLKEWWFAKVCNIFDIDKVEYRTNGKKVMVRYKIDDSHYIKSEATCHKTDTFNLITGLKLAVARLAVKEAEYNVKTTIEEIG